MSDLNIAWQNIEKMVMMVDLEKCLPTSLTSAQNFYSLKLLTLLKWTIFSNTTLVQAKELKYGQVRSGLIRPISKQKLECSDGLFFIINLIRSLKIINHKDLLRDHTHLEVDNDHSLHDKRKNCHNFRL